MREIEMCGKRDNVTRKTDDQNQPLEKYDDPVIAENLREAKEDRQFGSVSLTIYAKYFKHGAPAIFILLILLLVGAGQGRR